MNSQPRQPAGARHADTAAGGRFASKTVPNITEGGIGFNNDGDPAAAIGAAHEWDKRVVRIWGLETVFERTVETDDDGNEVVTITSDCEPPELLLLARRGDREYWSDNWRYVTTGEKRHSEERRAWCADIVCRMLNEGSVAIKYGAHSDGLYTAMFAAGSPFSARETYTTHTLTAVVAQIRGLRLIQSMAPDTGWETRFGGFNIPAETPEMLSWRFRDVAEVYKLLPRPPWGDDPAQTASSPPNMAGYVTNTEGGDIFVGERSDLLWRALTETVPSGGMSPLKTALIDRWNFDDTANEMVAAAALYDKTAETQLTTGLFDGAAPDNRAGMQQAISRTFAKALNPPDSGECRWTVEQQTRIHGFINTVEALEP